MTTFQTLDRTLALRCKRALNDENKITVNYEAVSGWTRLTGVVRSVRRINPSPLKVYREITIVDPREIDLETDAD
jgi:hypothetical protein